MHISKAGMVEILVVLKKHQVPLQHGVSLLCKAKGLTLSELSVACGYHRNSIYKALSGENNVQPDMIKKVENLLGVNPWDFMSDQSS
jgi:transcriptional regulator with XRE-family HTH domain